MWEKNSLLFDLIISISSSSSDLIFSLRYFLDKQQSDKDYKNYHKEAKFILFYPFKEPKLPYQDSKRWWSHMPIDFIHPLMTYGTGWDDQSCSSWYWLHCNKAVGAIERLNLQILLFIIHTFCMLPQMAFQALNTRLTVNMVKFSTYALKAIIGWIIGTHNIRMWHITTSRV